MERSQWLSHDWIAELHQPGSGGEQVVEYALLAPI
jgi:hypothetical protein